MIAFALRETGHDPAWLIGAPVPQLGSNAGAGCRVSRRRRRRVRSHRLLASGRHRRRHERRARPPLRVRVACRTRGRVRRVARGRARGRARRTGVRRWLALPGELNRLNAGRGARGARGRGRPAQRGGAVARAVHRHRAPVRDAHDSPTSRSSTTTPTIRGDRAHPRGGARALSRTHASGALPAAPVLADAAPGRRAGRSACRRRTTSR